MAENSSPSALPVPTPSVDHSGTASSTAENPPATEDASEARWDAVLSGLEDLYRDVLRRCLALPAFSLTGPRRTSGFRLGFRASSLILLDLIMLPVNIVIAARNLFPGGWQHRRFSAPLFPEVSQAYRRGEVVTVAWAVFRPLVSFMITVHAYNRLRLVAQRLYLDPSLNAQARHDREKRVNEILEHWKRPTAVQLVSAYVLPFSGPLAYLYTMISGLYDQVSLGSDPLLDIFLYEGEVSVVIYALLVPLSAFGCKRALMLGGEGPTAYVPGQIEGNGGYGEEAALLARVGIQVKEFPFDVLCSLLNIAAFPLILVEHTVAARLFFLWLLPLPMTVVILRVGYRRMVGDRR